jgi:hypothetical protein
VVIHHTRVLSLTQNSPCTNKELKLNCLRRRHNESDGEAQEGNEEKKSSKRHRKEKSRGKDKEAAEPSPARSGTSTPVRKEAGEEGPVLPGPPPPQARPAERSGSPKKEGGRGGSDSEEGQL